MRGMIPLFKIKVRRRRGITPRQLREKYGSLTTVNSSTEKLIEGVERQWKRYNDPEFQHKEFEDRMGKVFGSK
jgi:hypothetical protein